MTCLTDDMLSFSKKSRHQKYFTRKPAINMPFLCDHRYMWIKNEYFPEAIPWHSRSKPRASGSGHLGVSQFLFPLFSERSWPPCRCDSSSSLWGSFRAAFSSAPSEDGKRHCFPSSQERLPGLTPQPCRLRAHSPFWLQLPSSSSFLTWQPVATGLET